VFTTTDKKVRAVDVKSGADQWTYAGKAPFFAGAAIAGDVAYMADLNGVVHAVGLADGKARWKLDVGKETKLPGHVYGSPVVDGGRVYVSTCNLEAQEARKTVVVCIGEK
jgi:outer membrane protein assembly factor BamB